MTEDWRKGYLTAVNGDGGRNTWETGAFIAVQTEPYRVHPTTGMKFYLALEEARRDHYTKQLYHRVYSVGVASDGTQGGECSDYTEFNVLVEGYTETPLERFDQYQRVAISHYKRRYPQSLSDFPIIGQSHIYG